MAVTPMLFQNLKTCAAMAANSRWTAGWHDRGRIKIQVLNDCWRDIDGVLAIDSDGCWPDHDDFFPLVDEYIQTGIDAGINHALGGEIIR